MQKTNNKTRTFSGKSFEEIMSILKEVRKLYDNNDVKEIESARKRGRKVLKKVYFLPDEVLLKERGINNIYKLRAKFSSDLNKKIMLEHVKLGDAQHRYVLRHKDLWPSAGNTKITFLVKNGRITRKNH